MPSWRFLSLDAMKNATGVKRRHIPTFFTLNKIDIIYIMLNSVGVELELWNNCAPPLVLILISTSSSFRPLSLSPCLLVSLSPSYLTIALSCTYLLAFSFLGSLIVVASTLIMCDCVDCCGFCRESVLLFYKKLEKYIVMSKNVAIFAQTINLWHDFIHINITFTFIWKDKGGMDID